MKEQREFDLKLQAALAAAVADYKTALKKGDMELAEKLRRDLPDADNIDASIEQRNAPPTEVDKKRKLSGIKSDLSYNKQMMAAYEGMRGADRRVYYIYREKVHSLEKQIARLESKIGVTPPTPMIDTIKQLRVNREMNQAPQ